MDSSSKLLELDRTWPKPDHVDFAQRAIKNKVREGMKEPSILVKIHPLESSASWLVFPSYAPLAWAWYWTSLRSAHRRTKNRMTWDGMQIWKHLLYKGDEVQYFLIHRKAFDFSSLQWNKSNNIDKPCKIHMFEDIITLAEKKVCLTVHLDLLG